ncbi:TPA: hypothetical protein ACUNF5_002750 [Burkholderia orbicola]|nr:hypothetical protein DF039_30370 [Burkholderia cenocepacia]
MSDLPIYSAGLVELARTYDRARLAVHAAEWLDSDLRDGGTYAEGDGGLEDWTAVRVGLLADHLGRLHDLLVTQIAAESTRHFDVVVDSNGKLALPPVVQEAFEPYELPEFFYRSDADLAHQAERYLAERYLIIEEGDAHAIPRAYPPSFVEIWWPRYFVDPLVLVENQRYGWTCFGHEL